jgi:pantetheine-phosphate adenylyltransferase
VADRIQIIESSLHDLNVSNAQVILVPNGVLTVQVAETHGVDYLVRGIRTSEDFVYEMNLCRSNQSISQSIGTVFLPSPIQVSHISSSYVKEIISCHPHWDDFLLSRSILTEKAVEIIKKKLTPQEIV